MKVCCTGKKLFDACTPLKRKGFFMEKNRREKEQIFFNEKGNAEPVVEPDIYFDEKESFPLPEKREFPPQGNIAVPQEYFTYENAVFLLSCLEKLLAMIHSGKELKILRMRLNGMSYRQIASSLHIGLASINRLVRRVALHNPQVGFLLENVSSVTKKRDS